MISMDAYLDNESICIKNHHRYSRHHLASGQPGDLFCQQTDAAAYPRAIKGYTRT